MKSGRTQPGASDSEAKRRAPREPERSHVIPTAVSTAGESDTRRRRTKRRLKASQTPGGGGRRGG
ncbi:hypothetical protein EYF80_060209 [Liparis tanakae]|uniref:Uncharacterized protein n=1 Tax=Liparis tanakae TaxID=230148 RepID=A0A4Z2ELB9_9TELE|nr:hypothetical protein EYF80_060209 [Liparis tanakae]